MHKAVLLRFPLAVADALFLVIVGVIVLASTPGLAFAYVDPSVMTYTIQALAGVAVALSTILGVVYRRLRKRMVKALGIDENAGKVVDPDVSRVAAEDLAAENKRMAEFWKSIPAPGQAKELSFAGKFWRALIVCLFAFGALLLLAPVELVVANGSSLLFNLGYVWAPIVVFALAVSVVGAVLLALIPKRGFDIACAVVAAIGACFWIQSLFMNAKLPPANGAPVAWASPDYFYQTWGGALVWIAVIAIVVVFAIKSTKNFRALSVGVCSIFIAITLVGVGLIFADPASMNKSRNANQNYVTVEGINTLSPRENIVVFVLDMFDTNEFLSALDHRPYLLDEYSGFTYYPDSVGSMIPTHFALPYLMTGTWPSADEPFKEFEKNRYARSTFLKDVHDAGFDLGLYTDTMGDFREWKDIAPLTINQHPLADDADLKVDWWGTATIMAKCALYRDLPWLLKPYFWYYTDDINNAMSGAETAPASTPYVVNDQRYYNQMMENGLSLVDQGEKGSFRLIHLNGAHWPYTLHSDMTVDGKSTYDEQAEGALTIVRDYMRQMKDLGVYDSSTIIVTSDHGVWDWDREDMGRVTTPLFMAKPASSTPQTGAAVRSDLETGHIDYHATIMKAATGDAGKYGTSVFDVQPGVRDRKFLYPFHNGKVDLAITEYTVRGNALEGGNWSISNRWDLAG